MATWRRSSRCDSNQCVQVWPGCTTVWMRDAASTVLVMDRVDFRRMIAKIKETA